MHQFRLSILAGLFGNSLEWFDFILYAYFAPIFSILFFPSSNPYLSLLSTFGVFATGFFIRPVGGLILGRYGDNFGRRKALIASVTIMTLATLLIALLPTFSQVGIWAPIFLILLRLIQGIAVGGELTGSATYLIEHADINRRGFIGSLILSTAFMGMLVGSAATTTIGAVMTKPLLVSMGWRLAYLLGGLLGVFGIYLRFKSQETPQFLLVEKELPVSMRTLFMSHYKQLILGLIFTCVMAVGNYILIGYMTTYLVRFRHFSFEEAMIINFLSLLLLTILIPIFGSLSDKKGRKFVFWIGIVSLLIFAFPIFSAISNGNFYQAMFGELLLGFTLAPLNAVIPTVIVEMFPTNLRVTGSSIAYNIGQAIFGGTAPLISLVLLQFTGSQYAPAGYLFLCALIAGISLYYFRENNKMSLTSSLSIK